MVVKWRRINGKNVQINVPDDNSTLKERLAKMKGTDGESFKKHIMNSTEKNLSHQERVNYNSHPDRKKERDEEYERQYRQRNEYQNSQGFGNGVAGRVDMRMAGGDISEDSAYQMAMEDNGYHYSTNKKRYVR
jgi:hypothetical protein